MERTNVSEKSDDGEAIRERIPRQFVERYVSFTFSGGLMIDQLRRGLCDWSEGVPSRMEAYLMADTRSFCDQKVVILED